MKVLDLYRLYLKNSTIGISTSNQIRKLQYEANRIKEITEDVDHLYEDKAIFDKKDHSIYTLIKRDIFVASCEGNQDSAIQMAKFLLNELMAEIEGKMERLVA